MTRRRLTRSDLKAMIAARAEELELDGIARQAAEDQAQQELVEKVVSRLDVAMKARTCSVCGSWGIEAMGMCGRCYRRDLRKRHRIKTIRCLCCDQLFQAQRADAFLCSGRCRKRWLRMPSEDKKARLSPVPAQKAENGHAAQVSGVEKSPAISFARASKEELAPLSLEELQELQARGRAERNDALNSPQRLLSGTYLEPPRYLPRTDMPSFFEQSMAAHRGRIERENRRPILGFRRSRW